MQLTLLLLRDKQLKTEINGNTGANFENAKIKLKGKRIQSYSSHTNMSRFLSDLHSSRKEREPV